MHAFGTKMTPHEVCSRSRASLFVYLVGVICAITVICGSPARGAWAAEQHQHAGVKLQGYVTVVTSDSILVFDKKNNQEVQILTDKDYTSILGIASPVTVWYTTQGGVNRLEDIEYSRSGTFVPIDRLRESIQRIIILPKAEDVDNTQGLISAISNYLSDRAGWYVEPPELASEIAKRSKSPAELLDAINPDSGEVDMQRYLEAQRSWITVIANESRSDAVLEVRVIKVKAKVSGSIASWDDMTEPVASRKARELSPFGWMESRGWVYAATADMALWSHDGKLLWKKRRGFAVLGVQSGMSPQYHERPLTEVYQDNKAMQRWLQTTLGELAPSPR